MQKLDVKQNLQGKADFAGGTSRSVASLSREEYLSSHQVLLAPRAYVETTVSRTIGLDGPDESLASSTEDSVFSLRITLMFLHLLLQRVASTTIVHGLDQEQRSVCTDASVFERPAKAAMEELTIRPDHKLS